MTLLCDFCSKPNPPWEYPCRSFLVESLEVDAESVDEWLACDKCKTYIEDGNYDALARRCAKRITGTTMTVFEAMALHTEFRAHRCGLVRAHGTVGTA